MEVDHQLELGRVAQDVVVQLHDVLLVALEEVDLDALDAPLVQQLELEAPHLGLVQAAARLLGDDVVRSARVVPEQQAHALLRRVAGQFPHVAAVHQRPVGVDQGVLPAHLGGQVDELPLLAKSCGLSWSDHQLQATRPGLIQLVSATAQGGFRSSTSVDSTIPASVSATRITRQGVLHGSVDCGPTSPTPLPSPACGKRMR